jgi:tryptophan-rich sensory protein
MFVSWRAFSFWNIVSWITNILLIVAFGFRMGDLAQNDNKMNNLRLKSFQVLSFVAPLIWCVLLCLVIASLSDQFLDLG